MNVKDSKSSNYNSLVMLYQEYHKRIYKKSIFIREEKTLKRFEEMQHKLLKEGISLEDYAENVLILAKTWAKSKNMDRIPANMFLGQFLYKKYITLKGKKSVKLSGNEESEDVLYIDEVLVAKHYISKRHNSDVRFSDVVTELSDMLSHEWKLSYDNDRLRKYTTRVLNELELLYNKSATSYRDLADKLYNGNN